MPYFIYQSEKLIKVDLNNLLKQHLSVGAKNSQIQLRGQCNLKISQKVN